MRSFFQIFFCILSALCVAAAAVLGALFGLIWFFVGVIGALFFACMTLLVKNGNPFRETKEPKADFMNSDEENKKIDKNE